MTKRVFLLRTLLALAGLRMAFYAMPQVVPNRQAETGIIQGVVTRRGTNNPIPEVRITVTRGAGSGQGVVLGPAGEIIPVEPPPGTGNANTDAGRAATTSQPFQSAVTDSAGRFAIAGVPVGTVRVRAQLEGYFGPLVAGQYSSFSATDVTVSPGKPANISISLIPAATISGRVFSPLGKPLADALVQIFRLGYEEGTATLWTVKRQTTDDRGEYRLHSLPPGRYYLSADPRSVAGALSGNVRSTTREIPVQTFYPNTTEPTLAAPVSLDGGEELRGIDINVGTVMTGTISGKVSSTLPPGPVSGGPRGTRPSTPILSLARLDALVTVGDAILGNGIQADPDGTFEIRNVVPGAYDVVARVPVAANRGWAPFGPPARAAAPWTWGRARVEVGRGTDVQGVALVVHNGLDLGGRLIVDGNPTRADVRISVYADRTSSPSDSIIQQILQQISAFTPTIEPDGSFIIPLLPEGKYRFQISIGGLTPTGTTAPQAAAQISRSATAAPSPLPATAYVADIRQGGSSVYDNGLTVESSGLSPVDIIINTNGGSVQGTVMGRDQKPVRAIVVVVPPENRRQNPALYRPARSDAQGRFQVESIPPGAYKLFAWENAQNGAWQNSQFLTRYEQYGVPVTIGAGVRASANVTLAPNDPQR